jgi:hypothetical protein
VFCLLGNDLSLTTSVISWAFNNSTLFEKNELNVAWGRFVGVDTTVCSVCAAAHVWGAVDLCVLDDQVTGNNVLEFSSVAGVVEKTENELAALDWPATLGPLNLLAHCLATNTAIPVALEGNDLLLGHDVLKEGGGAIESHTLDGVDGLAGVLVVNTKVGAAGTDNLLLTTSVISWTLDNSTLLKKNELNMARG